jgi:hypothetical protein
MATLRASFYTIGNLITEAELLQAHLEHFRNAKEGQDEKISARIDQVRQHLRAMQEGLSAIRLELEA